MLLENKILSIRLFLCFALFIASGCSGEADVSDIGNTTGGTPLIIRTTVSAYTAIGEENAPSTRIPAENGLATEFSDGDAIGLFALKNFEEPSVATIDEVYNLKLIYTKAADGTVSWAPAAGDTHVLYSYDDDLTYMAYYPYREGITIKQDLKREILKDLANNAKLQPAADQSTPAGYTGSDLMAAVANPTTDPANANKKVLTLNFEHLHALLVFKPGEGYLNYVAPDGSFEYRDEARVLLSSPATETILNNVKALPMDDGSFRAIIPTSLSATAFTPSGSYSLADGKTLLFSAPQLAVGTLTAGKYYTLKTDTRLSTKPRRLQIGDFFFRDGKFLHREISTVAAKNECVGVVFYVGRHPSDTGVYLDKNGNPMEVHGYAVALRQTDALGHIGWGGPGTYSNTSTDTKDFNGYSNTQKIKEAAGGTLTGNGGVPACYNWSATVPNTTSGWFCPSAGQLNYISLYFSSLIQPSMNKVGGSMTGGEYHHFWSSTEPVNDGSKAYMVSWPGGGAGAYGKGGWLAAQAAIAF